MLTNCEDLGQITLCRVATNRMTSADLVSLEQARAVMKKRGRAALLVDLSGVRHIARSGQAAMVEFARAFPFGAGLGFFGAQGPVAEAIAACPLTSLLQVFPTRDAALSSSEFRGLRLAGMKAVVLCAGKGTRMGPLSRTVPKPMLEFLGKPVLERILDSLGAHGIRDFVLNPGHLASSIHDHFHPIANRSLFFVNEGRMRDGNWQASPIGSASTLAALRDRHCAFGDDFLVLCGDALIDIDFPAMLDLHRTTGADVTMAVKSVSRRQVSSYGIVSADGTGQVTGFQEKPDPAVAASTLASTGIYIMNPRALDGLADRPGQDIAMDLLPMVLSKGGRVQVFNSDIQWVDIGCGRDYFGALSQGLAGGIAGVSPDAEQVRPGIWIAPGAQVSRRARLSGPCFIGADACIEPGAQVIGPAVVGAGAILQRRTLVRQSVILRETLLRPGALADGMIVHPDWAVAHRFADGTPQCTDPIDHVASVSAPRTVIAGHADRQARAAS